MIKIIKQGEKIVKYKTIYTITCPNCCCEFECELEDFKMMEKCLDGDKVIDCPCCGKELHTRSLDIKTRAEEIKEKDNFIPYIDDDKWWLKGGIYPDPNIKDPCETCPNRYGPRDGLGRPIPGDSPCQWCQHYKYKITWTTNINGGPLDNFRSTIGDKKDD